MPGRSVTRLDPNPGMLEVARREAPDVTWISGVAEGLPMPAGTFDRVLSQFALMFFTDPARALSEMARVLRPEGRLCVATWAEAPSSPGYNALIRLLSDVARRAAAEALRRPFVIGTEEQLQDVGGGVFEHGLVRR
ncbi:MAG: class I SAM-dependent methyltransferase [Lapillicoccus sp.]